VKVVVSRVAPRLIHRAEQLALQDELALFVLLARLIRLVILPAYRLLALPAVNVANNVSPRRHIALVGLGFSHIDDAVEEVGFAVLAAKVLREISTRRSVSHLPGRLTLLSMSSRLDRWVLQFLHA
jgi:hypothetical protein